MYILKKQFARCSIALAFLCAATISVSSQSQEHAPPKPFPPVNNDINSYPFFWPEQSFKLEPPYSTTSINYGEWSNLYRVPGTGSRFFVFNTDYKTQLRGYHRRLMLYNDIYTYSEHYVLGTPWVNGKYGPPKANLKTEVPWNNLWYGDLNRLSMHVFEPKGASYPGTWQSLTRHAPMGSILETQPWRAGQELFDYCALGDPWWLRARTGDTNADWRAYPTTKNFGPDWPASSPALAFHDPSSHVPYITDEVVDGHVRLCTAGTTSLSNDKKFQVWRIIDRDAQYKPQSFYPLDAKVNSQHYLDNYFNNSLSLESNGFVLSNDRLQNPSRAVTAGVPLSSDVRLKLPATEVDNFKKVSPGQQWGRTVAFWVQFTPSANPSDNNLPDGTDNGWHTVLNIRKNYTKSGIHHDNTVMGLRLHKNGWIGLARCSLQHNPKVPRLDKSFDCADTTVDPEDNQISWNLWHRPPMQLKTDFDRWTLFVMVFTENSTVTYMHNKKLSDTGQTHGMKKFYERAENYFKNTRELVTGISEITFGGQPGSNMPTVSGFDDIVLIDGAMSEKQVKTMIDDMVLAFPFGMQPGSN